MTLFLGACGLPKGGGRTPSTAMTGNVGTRLAELVGPRVAAHPGLSGLHTLPDGSESLAARLALADSAQCSLDVQHFIWNKDMSGRVTIKRSVRTADRDVRVRLFLDDLTLQTTPPSHSPRRRRRSSRTTSRRRLPNTRRACVTRISPGKLASVRKRGVRVVVITHPLGSTDGVPVHSKYQHYRKPLIEAGIELYEVKPIAGAQLKRRFREPAGSSTGGPHAKTFTFDRRIGFIGSYNLDPRSSNLNTEMGVLFDCPPLARRLPEQTECNLAENAHRMELDGNRLVWVTREGGREVQYYSEPHPPGETHQGPDARLATDRVAALKAGS